MEESKWPAGRLQAFGFGYLKGTEAGSPFLSKKSGKAIIFGTIVSGGISIELSAVKLQAIRGHGWRTAAVMRISLTGTALGATR